MKYNHTRVACYTGYVTQAIVNNLAPLLFLTFQREFTVSLGQLTLLVSLNFAVQLVVDILSAGFVDKIGYRASAMMAHLFCVAGLLSMGILPRLLPSAYAGLVIAIVLNAIGGGIIEVIISPIVEALPGEQKAAQMSLLHSFYCWGSVAVVLLSTLSFRLAGMDNWPWLPVAWALVPLLNAFFFTKVPLVPLVEEGKGDAPSSLFKRKKFLLFFLMMLCAGASEQAMSQWASLFAEGGLGVSKTVGDLLGPCLFAVLMGLSRIWFGLGKNENRLEAVLMGSSVLCVASYMLAVFAPHPLLSLLGCGLCGLSVGVMWPGSISLASRGFPRGGTAMFAILALAGDVGCSTGPGLVGIVSDLAAGTALGDFFGGTALKAGLMVAAVFPILLAFSSSLAGKHAQKSADAESAA